MRLTTLALSLFMTLALVAPPVYSALYKQDGKAVYQFRPNDSLTSAYKNAEDLAVTDAMKSLPPIFLDEQNSLTATAPWLIGGGLAKVVRTGKEIRRCDTDPDSTCAYVSVSVTVNDEKIQLLVNEITKNAELRSRVEDIIIAELNITELSGTEKEWQLRRRQEVFDEILSLKTSLGSFVVDERISGSKVEHESDGLLSGLVYSDFVMGLKNNIQVRIDDVETVDDRVKVDFSYTVKDEFNYSLQSLIELMGGDHLLAERFAYNIFRKANSTAVNPSVFAIFPRYIKDRPPALLYVNNKSGYLEIRIDEKRNRRLDPDNQNLMNELCDLYSDFRGHFCSNFGLTKRPSGGRSYSLATDGSEEFTFLIFDRFLNRDKTGRNAHFQVNDHGIDVDANKVAQINDLKSLTLYLEFVLDGVVAVKKPILYYNSYKPSSSGPKYHTVNLLRPMGHQLSFNLPANSSRQINYRLSVNHAK